MKSKQEIEKIAKKAIFKTPKGKMSVQRFIKNRMPSYSQSFVPLLVVNISKVTVEEQAYVQNEPIFVVRSMGNFADARLAEFDNKEDAENYAQIIRILVVNTMFNESLSLKNILKGVLT